MCEESVVSLAEQGKVCYTHESIVSERSGLVCIVRAQKVLFGTCDIDRKKGNKNEENK